MDCRYYVTVEHRVSKCMTFKEAKKYVKVLESVLDDGSVIHIRNDSTLGMRVR